MAVTTPVQFREWTFVLPLIVFAIPFSLDATLHTESARNAKPLQFRMSNALMALPAGRPFLETFVNAMFGSGSMVPSRVSRN